MDKPMTKKEILDLVNANLNSHDAELMDDDTLKEVVGVLKGHLVRQREDLQSLIDHVENFEKANYE